MYIDKVNIENIRSIEKLEMQFEEGSHAGWHVIIGDNGSGKSTLVKSLALSVISSKDFKSTNFGALRTNPKEWLSQKVNKGYIKTDIFGNFEFAQNIKPDNKPKIIDIKVEEHEDLHHLIAELVTNDIPPIIRFNREEEEVTHEMTFKTDSIVGKKFINKIFSSAFGPFRRFSGGNSELKKLFKTHPKLARHLSIFKEDVDLSEALDWLQDVNYKRLEEKDNGSTENEDLLKSIFSFFNQSDLLPSETKLEKVNSDGIWFKDANGCTIEINDLSDGYRSILSLILELIRQLVGVFGSTEVFETKENGSIHIKCEGIVLIDEVDAHLHPTWQVRIGEWFLKYFPKFQFIVTTHSPLICRAAKNGSIWQMPEPGSDEQFRKLEGLEYKRLVYGNILDAYGTEAFGESTIVRSQESEELKDLLGELNIKAAFGDITDEENEKRIELSKILSTDDPTH
ncbi:MAG: putative ATP-dependent endonuclease of OLD family [Bacteroidia bacterium]|jgi:predicted ATP-dependent endonuclease of OLD family